MSASPACFPETLLPATPPPETATLTAGMAAGDSAAVATFYGHYFRFLFSEARRATRRDEAFCLDVVQEATLRIVRTIASVDNEARLIAWLKLVVRTTALDLLRREKRRRVYEAAMVPPESAKDESACERAERMEWLGKQIAIFAPELVRIIEMRFENRWTLRKIASLLGLSIGTIDGRLRRAITHLRERAQEDFE